MVTENIPTPSRLEALLVKNSKYPGLSFDEMHEAQNLINKPEYSSEICGSCKKESILNKSGAINPDDLKHRAIYDVGMCQSHAFYTLFINSEYPVDF